MAILVNPFDRSVAPWTPEGAFLDALRATLDCQQIDSMMIQKNLCIFVDNFGMLRPSQAFFRFRDTRHRFAGKAVITGTDPDGMPCSWPEGTPDLVRAALDWCDNCRVVAIDEHLQAEPTPFGMWPRVVRSVTFDPPDEPDAPVAPVAPEAPQDTPALQASQPPQIRYVWVVRSDDSADAFVAVEAHAATATPTGRVEVFKELGDMTAFMKSIGATRAVDPPDAPDDVVANFTVVG
jgi:hypothetical protein